MNTETIDLAHQVIDRNEDWETGDTARALARTVLDLTKKVKKAQALHQSAGEQLDDYGYTYETCRVCDSAWPCATSAELNGGDA